MPFSDVIVVPASIVAPLRKTSNEAGVKRTVPVAFAPTSSLPVAVKSTEIVLRVVLVVVLIVPSCRFEPSESPIVTRVLSGKSEVRALIVMVACGAKKIAHTKKTIRTTSAAPPIKSFLRILLKSGTFTFFLRSEAADVSAALSSSDAARVAGRVAGRADTEVAGITGSGSSDSSSLPSMTSSSSTSSAGISAISGRLCNVRAVGILAEAAKVESAWLPVIMTSRLPACSAARWTSLRLTALCMTPIRLGGTSATIFCEESFTLPMMAVMSSSVSI